MPTENLISNIPGGCRFWYGNPSNPSGGSLLDQSPVRSWSKYRVGNWDRKRPDPLTPSAYTLTATKQRKLYADVVGKTGYGDWRRYVGYHGAPDLASVTPSVNLLALRDAALVDALTNLKDQKFNAGVAIAEASGTAKLALDIMRSVTAVRRHFVHGEFELAYKRFLRNFHFQEWKPWRSAYGGTLGLKRRDYKSDVPSTWLYYHFGIKPTIQDLDNLHQDWFRRHATQQLNFKSIVKGKASHSESVRKSLGFLVGAVDVQSTYRASVRVRLEVVLRDGFLARMAQLGGTNIPEAVWNGIPFSWLVDYFTTFGDWLSVLDAGMGYSFGQTVESTLVKHKAKSVGMYYCTSPSVPNGSFRPDSHYQYEYVSLVRKLPSGLYPPMYSVLPRVKVDLSPRRFANALSALAVVFGGRSNAVVRT